MERFQRTNILNGKSTGLLRAVVLMKKGMTRKIIVINGEHLLKSKRENFMSKNHTEIYHLIEITSIIEVSLREFFCLPCLSYISKYQK